MTADALETVSWALQRHRLVVRGVATIASMLVAAAVVNAAWNTTLGTVIAGLFIVFSGALALVMLVVGVSMGIHRLRHGQAG